MGELDGKVAIVTGAAHGLGRVEALQLAAAGARVVVNDIGAKGDGSGRDEGPAQAVVDEIKAAGGEAVAHFGDCADWKDGEALLKTALDTFGDVNIVVNNAGFVRDGTMFKMTEQDFDAVVRVHLKGHFVNMAHAARYWRETSKAKGAPIYGRLVSTASEAALFCPPGQPNYAAAKSGIVTLTMGAATLLHKYGVTANVIMPRARTRMTLDSAVAAMFEKPAEGFDNMAPENVAPLVTYLASEKAERMTGYVLVVWGKQVQLIERPKFGPVFESPEPWTVASLHEQLGPHFEKLEPLKDGFALPGA